jgi:hypothetical protein
VITTELAFSVLSNKNWQHLCCARDKQLLIMKRTLLAALFTVTTALTSFAGIQGHDDPHEPGFRLNFHMGLTGHLYGADEGTDADLFKDIRPAKTFGIEFGNKFTFKKFGDDKMSVGLMVDWFAFDFGYRVLDGPNGDINSMTMNLGFLEFGPSFTYSLNDEMGFDVYYQLKPTVIYSGFVTSDDIEVVLGSGFSHAVGIAYRYKAYNIAFEPNFGAVKAASTGSSELNLESKVNTTNFRILLGFKF